MSSDGSQDKDCEKDWVIDLGLSQYDKHILTSQSWLTSNHIGAAHLLLKRSFPCQTGLQDTVYLVEKLQWRSTPQNFVQIIHIGGFHWACVSNIRSPNATSIQLYDSLHLLPDATVQEQCCTILKCLKDSFKLQIMNVQIQGAGDTCGLFAIAMAFDLCSGQDPCLVSYDESRMRAHLERCFNKQALSRFPRSRENSNYPNKRRVVDEIIVPVYCSCRYPDVDISSRFGDMAACDVCSQWYHQHCENIPEAVFTQEQDFWICSTCGNRA